MKEKTGVALFLFAMIILSIALIFSGTRSEREEVEIVETTPTPTVTPTATPSATPVVRQNRTPERVIITQPQAGSSAQPQAQPAPAPVTNNSSTTVVQPAPQPTQAPQPTPQPTPQPGVFNNVIDSVRKIL